MKHYLEKVFAIVLCILFFLTTHLSFAGCSDVPDINNGPDTDWFNSDDDFWGNNNWWEQDDDPFGFNDDEWDDFIDNEDWWGEQPNDDDNPQDDAKDAKEKLEDAKEKLADKNKDLTDAEKELLKKKRFFEQWARLMADRDFNDRPQAEKDAIVENTLRLQKECDENKAELQVAQEKQAAAAEAAKDAAEVNAKLQNILAQHKQEQAKKADEQAKQAAEKAKKEQDSRKKAALEQEARKKQREANQLKREAEQAKRRAKEEERRRKLAEDVEDDYNDDFDGGGDNNNNKKKKKNQEEIKDMDIDMDQPESWFGFKDRNATAKEVQDQVMENLTRISGSKASDSSNLAISQADKFQKGEYAKSNLEDIAAVVMSETLSCGMSKMTGPVGKKLKSAIENVMDKMDTAKEHYGNAKEVYDSIKSSLQKDGLQVHQETFKGYNYTLTTTTAFDPKTNEYTTYVSRIPTGSSGTMSRAMLDCSMKEFSSAMAGKTSSAVINGKINYK